MTKQKRARRQSLTTYTSNIKVTKITKNAIEHALKVIKIMLIRIAPEQQY